MGHHVMRVGRPSIDLAQLATIADGDLLSGALPRIVLAIGCLLGADTAPDYTAIATHKWLCQHFPAALDAFEEAFAEGQGVLGSEELWDTVCALRFYVEDDTLSPARTKTHTGYDELWQWTNKVYAHARATHARGCCQRRMEIPLSDFMPTVEKVAREGFCALVIDKTNSDAVRSFLRYQQRGCTAISGKGLVVRSFNGQATCEELVDELHLALRKFLNNSTILHID